MSTIGFLGFIVFLVLFILALIKKRQKKVSAIGMLLCFIIFIAGAITIEPNDSKEVNKTDIALSETSKQENKTEAETEKKVDKTEAETSGTIVYEVTLDNGYYTAGIDFPAGTYDLEAVSGGGNVSSSNLLKGGINTMMGIESKNVQANMDIYKQKYSNIKLPEGTVLSLGGVEINLTCDKASSKPLTPRNQEITEEIILENGNFVAGEDFIEGIYDIEAVSGAGNVSSSNLLNGGINAMMGIEAKNTELSMDIYEQKYMNIDLKKDVSISIDGVSIKLTPSK